MSYATEGKRREQLKAIFFLALTNLIWGTYFPLVKAWYQLVGFPSMDTAAPLGSAGFWPPIVSTFAWLSARFVVALTCFAVIYPRSVRAVSRDTLVAGMQVGTVFFAGMFSQLLGLRLIGATRNALITALTVLVTPWMSVIFYRKLPSGRLFTACVLSFFGAAVLVGFVGYGESGLLYDREALGLGDFVTFLGTIFFSTAIFLIDSAHKRGVRGNLTLGMFSAVLILSTSLALLLGNVLPPVYAGSPHDGLFPFPFQGLSEYRVIVSSWTSALLFLVIVVPTTVFGFHWMNKYQGYFSPSHAALIYMLEPLSTALWAMTLPGLISPILGIDYPSEQLTAQVIIGGTIILLANLLPSLDE